MRPRPTRSSSGGESPSSWNRPHAGHRPRTRGQAAPESGAGVSASASARGCVPRSSTTSGVAAWHARQAPMGTGSLQVRGEVAPRYACGWARLSSRAADARAPGPSGDPSGSVARTHRRCSPTPGFSTVAPRHWARGVRCGAVRGGPRVTFHLPPGHPSSRGASRRGTTCSLPTTGLGKTPVHEKAHPSRGGAAKPRDSLRVSRVAEWWWYCMFWDGERWLPERPPAVSAARPQPRRRHRDWLATGVMMLALDRAHGPDDGSLGRYELRTDAPVTMV